MSGHRNNSFLCSLWWAIPISSGSRNSAGWQWSLQTKTVSWILLHIHILVSNLLCIYWLLLVLKSFCIDAMRLRKGSKNKNTEVVWTQRQGQRTKEQVGCTGGSLPFYPLEVPQTLVWWARLWCVLCSTYKGGLGSCATRTRDSSGKLNCYSKWSQLRPLELLLQMESVSSGQLNCYSK